MKPLVYAIHGILTGQTTASWPDKFDAWCERQGVEAHIEKKEYQAGPWPWWNRLVKNPRIAAGIVAEIREMMPMAPRARAIHFVAHSNGTHIALCAVKQLAALGIPTHTIILVGSICEPDIEQNGIAQLMRDGKLINAYAYSSKWDRAVSLTERPFLKTFGGYRDLGVTGWKEKGRVLPCTYRVANAGDGAPVHRWVTTRDFTPFDHSDYFTDAHRENTFTQFRKDLGL